MSKRFTIIMAIQALFWRAVIIGVFTVVYIRTADFELGFAGAVKWTFFLVLGWAEWIMYYHLFLSTKFNVLKWWHTIRVLGFPSAEARRQMQILTEYTDRRGAFAWPDYFLFLAVLLPVYLFLRWGIVLAIILTCTQAQIAERFRRICPAAVLLLTTSTSDGLDLYGRISYATGRLRAVALLRMEQVQSTFTKFMVRSDCFRTTDDAKWREVVDKFIELVPIVVLDTRSASPGLMEESNWVLTPEHAYKLILLVDDTGQRALIEAVEASSRNSLPLRRISVVRERGLLYILNKITKSRDTLPSPERQISTIISTIPNIKTVDRINELSAPDSDWGVFD